MPCPPPHSTHASALPWVLVALAAALASPARASREATLVVATWNLEWLVSPATAHSARLACRQSGHAALPCDALGNASRDSADIARLARYARELNADVIAFQEVENQAIARKVFAGYQICMADGSGIQHVGFAVRPELPHRCGPALDSLALEGHTRKGMTLKLTPANGPPIELLAVHLKSGCSREPLETNTTACQQLRQQALILGAWIEARAMMQDRFIVLGDFNRVPPLSDDDPFWQRVRTTPLHLLAEHLTFGNCQRGQAFTAFIDQILLSSSLASHIVGGSARHPGFRSSDAVRYHLSDHCPVSISLNLPGLAPGG